MKSYLDFGINFILTDNLKDQSFEVDCPKCFHHNISSTLIINDQKKSWFCKHCGYAGDLFFGIAAIPKKNTHPWEYNPNLFSYTIPKKLNSSILNFFNSKKISEKTLTELSIGQGNIYYPKNKTVLPSVIYPYFQKSKVINLSYFNSQLRHEEYGGVFSCFNYDNINLEHTYITLNEIETMSFYEVGKKNTISLFNPSSNVNIENILDNLFILESVLLNVKKITLAFPNTKEGLFLTEELTQRLGKEKCWKVLPPEDDSSWNDMLVAYGNDKFLSFISKEIATPIKGIYEVSDVRDEINNLYKYGLKKGVSTSYLSLDEYLSIPLGQWTVVTGIPSHGKSNFLDSLLVKLALNENWKFAIFSPENQPTARYYSSIMEKYFEKPFDIKYSNRISEEEKEKGLQWMEEHFSVILPDEDDTPWSIEHILNLAKISIYRKGVKGIVIDPWNELEHVRPPQQTETEYISSALSKIRNFARKHNVHIWVVAHPAKLYKNNEGKYPVPTPYDINGSAHWRNKADICITVWRNVGFADESVTDIYIQKMRFKEFGKVGLCSLRYDYVSSSFIDDIDQNKRKKALEDGIVLPIDKLRLF